MDHYKVLGIPKSASKEEIKESFRKLAMKFHPDKHSQSPKSVKDSATVKFKRVSEAYEVLMDDHKRANYDYGRGSFHGNRRTGGSYGSSSYSRGTYGYNGGGNDYYGGGRYYKYGYGRSQGVSRVQLVFQYTKTRAFLLNLAFASILLGGAYVVEVARDRLWKMQNSGKSFESAMETIEKAKADRES